MHTANWLMLFGGVAQVLGILSTVDSLVALERRRLPFVRHLPFVRRLFPRPVPLSGTSVSRSHASGGLTGEIFKNDWFVRDAELRERIDEVDERTERLERNATRQTAWGSTALLVLGIVLVTIAGTLPSI